jgi:septum formation protein
VNGPLVLASGSPRRREILARLGLEFEVIIADVDETPIPGETPRVYSARAARDKAQAVRRADPKGRALVAADTIVVCDGDILGKPTDPGHATKMLSRLSGRWHRVITAVCVIDGAGAEQKKSVETEVRFRSLSEGTIARYVATGEGEDKAGSYGIQDLGSALVAELRGSYTNVVGLPAAETLEMLQEASVVGNWP